MEFYTGKVGSDLRRQYVSFGTLDTVAYATGDILTSGALTVPYMARAEGMSGTLVRVLLKETTSGTLQKPSLRLWFFGTSLTPASRNSPQAFTSSQIDSLIGYVDVLNANYLNAGTGVATIETTVNIPYVLQPTSTTIYLVPEVRAAYTFHSTAQIVAQIIAEVS
jgi:hypothetical protein